MTAPWTEWDHVVKLDPDKTLYGDETFTDVCETGTDAIEIGGTLDITTEKMREYLEPCLAACAEHDVACYIEPSHSDAIIHDPSPDGFLVPIVLNAGDTFWTTGAHLNWVKTDDQIDWDRTFNEAYIIMNPDSSVATYTGANCDLDADDVAAYATVAERMLGQDIVYLEYSGMLGDTDIVTAAHDALEEATLFYGGGIGSYDDAYQMRQHADTVIVGDLIHDEGADVVAKTVDGAKAAATEIAPDETA
ncbi:MAG: putative phosphoglycerol geranylgeranyltransferase [Halobacteriales archaeon]|nr:putative phosphoglycerol geranylgeranyltransferase [Halobacteriales archaeon]